MKLTVRFLILLLGFTACSPKENVIEVVLDESIIPENATDVSLRPTFGFQSVYGGLNTSYKFFCDTITPPQKEVAGTSGSVFNVMCLESEILKPNKIYYWFCKALKEGHEYPTDIYSFTTIDTSLLNGHHWHYQYVLST